MKAKLVYPILEAHGQILGKKAGVYFRTNKQTGAITVHPNPVRTKPQTAKQRVMNNRMRLATRRYREICADPLLSASLRTAFAAQSRHHRFYDFVLSEILSGRLQ